MFEEIVNNEHTFLDKQICVHEHYNFIPIVQSLFNCFPVADAPAPDVWMSCS